MKKHIFAKRLLILVLTAAMILSAGCSKKTSDSKPAESQSASGTQIKIKESDKKTSDTSENPSDAQDQPQTEAAPEPAGEVLPEGKARSPLTGEIVDAEIARKRPFAIMINNIQDATPQQAGTSAVDILYEAVVEGGITRMMGIFQDTSAIKKIGTVRSLRHYYIGFASNFNAVICHYGWSVYAQEMLTDYGIKTISQNIGPAYFQDNNYSAPHHIFADGESLEAGLAAIGANPTLPDGYTGSFIFTTEDTDLSIGSIANTVSIPFQFSKARLEYDAQSKLYKKFQYGAPHTDANNGEQLAFKNIIIQYCQYEDIVGGSGCQEVRLNGEGKAIYITNGKSINITWKNSDYLTQCQFFYEDGTRVQMNPGKTYIAVVPTTFDVSITE